MPPGKDKDTTASAEISRLSALVAKDPRSKLFIPLAEEYIKAGMTDQAVTILERGLKANPFYMSARVMLGKAHLEKGDKDRAREEFEQVVKVVPDNLFAHRKLGEIYMGQGMRAEAVRAFRMVTILNPKDEEAKRFIEEMESGPKTATVALESGHKVEEASHTVSESVPGDDTVSPPEPSGPEAFDITEPEAPEPEEPQAAIIEMPVPEMETIGPLEEAPREKEDTTLTAEEETAYLEPPGQVSSEKEAPGPATGYALEVPSDSIQEIFSAYAEAVPEEETAPEAPGGVYEIDEDVSSFDIEGVVAEAAEGPEEPVEALPVEEEPPAPTDVFETRTLAELYVSQGFYDRAIGIYKNLLLEEPDSAELKAKLDEVYRKAGAAASGGAAEKRLSGDKEETIRRLESFLDSLRRKAGR